MPVALGDFPKRKVIVAAQRQGRIDPLTQTMQPKRKKPGFGAALVHA